MGEILILKSINGHILTNKLIDSWFDANQMFITKKNFSHDRYSVEITFIDEERADMMSDLLGTCYSPCVSVSRPETLAPSLNHSFEEEREPSPVHLSSAMSTSSRISCFSQRLVELDRNKNANKIKLAIGRGREMETKSLRTNKSFLKDRENDNKDSIENSNATSPVPSINNSTVSSVFGRGRGAVFK